MSNIRGHAQQRKALARLVQSGKLPTTILFSGVEGVGKQLVAKELARSLLCETTGAGGCDNCEYCSLFDAGNHPDFFSLSCSNKEADVDSLRELLYSLNLKSFYGKNRVVIFNDADAMGVQAANLLLKSLEEPRPNTYFILIAAHRGSLPPTLVSRCQVWFFDRLSDQDVRAILERSLQKESGMSIDELVLLADGSLAYVNSLTERAEQWKEISDTLQAIASGRLARAPEFANALAKDKEHLPETLQLLRICARSHMLEETTPGKKAAWANCLSNLITAERALFERNLAPGTVLLTVLLALHTESTSPAFTPLPNGAKLLEKFFV